MVNEPRHVRGEGRGSPEEVVELLEPRLLVLRPHQRQALREDGRAVDVVDVEVRGHGPLHTDPEDVLIVRGASARVSR